jgi:outer membrane biosynthesis protein TonB
VPDGFTASALHIAHPLQGRLYVKLRDDPAIVSVVVLNVKTAPPASAAAAPPAPAPEHPPEPTPQPAITAPPASAEAAPPEPTPQHPPEPTPQPAITAAQTAPVHAH